MLPYPCTIAAALSGRTWCCSVAPRFPARKALTGYGRQKGQQAVVSVCDAIGEHATRATSEFVARWFGRTPSEKNEEARRGGEGREGQAHFFPIVAAGAAAE